MIRVTNGASFLRVAEQQRIIWRYHLWYLRFRVLPMGCGVPWIVNGAEKKSPRL